MLPASATMGKKLKKKCNLGKAKIKVILVFLLIIGIFNEFMVWFIFIKISKKHWLTLFEVIVQLHTYSYDKWISHYLLHNFSFLVHCVSLSQMGLLLLKSSSFLSPYFLKGSSLKKITLACVLYMIISGSVPLQSVLWTIWS